MRYLIDTNIRLGYGIQGGNEMKNLTIFLVMALGEGDVTVIFEAIQ